MIHLKTPINKAEILRQMKANADEVYSESHEKEDKIAAYMSGVHDVFQRLQLKTDPQPTELTDLPAPNTVMWWLCRIADPEIRRKAVGNALKYPRKQPSLKLAIGDGFEWEDTNEIELWNRLFYTGLPTLPEPDFTEYNELTK